MNKPVFRSIDFWKSAVMTMQDNSFFELLRSVFGKIKTPFKKQQLLNDLEIFLLREDIQKNIAAYISQNDAKVIAGTALFGEPVIEELENFFSDELSSAQLQDIIVNLEERFILYRFTEEKTSRLALNPVLEQVLRPIIADTNTLFPTVSETGDTSSAPKAGHICVNDFVLAGLLSFASQWESFYRTEGVVRKRALDAAKTAFPGMNFELVCGSLQVLGLFYAEGDRLVPDRKRFDDFGLLSVRERGEYCAAAILVFSELNRPSEILPPLFRSGIREFVSFIHNFLNSIKPETLYPEKTLIRMFEVLKAESGLELNGDTLFDAMEKAGLLVSVSPELRLLGEAVNDKMPKNDSPLIAIDSGFSILVYPEINFADAVKLASVLNIREVSTVVRFELDRDSAVRAFDDGIGAEQIIELLKRLSLGKVDEALVWNLKDWEKRHKEVALKKGVVLSLSEDRRYLTQTMPLAEMINETLAPGLYLLNENAMEDAASALRGAGIDIIARRKEKKESPVSAGKYFSSPSSHEDLKASVGTEAGTEVGMGAVASKTPVFKIDPKQAAALTAGFQTILGKMPLTEAEKSELSARINRRLVLCETQLKEASIRYEKLEARHMDYAGKQNIAKQAITQQSPVEIVWPGGSGESIFGIPQALEKEEGDLFLALIPSGEKEAIRVPLAKISLLRRIKKSIFET